MAKEWTADEVAQHNTKEDCYVIVHGRVYDVSEYLNKHPGGFNLLFRVAGKDATKDFEGMFHSKKARLILEDMCVGTLKGSTLTSGGSSAGGFLTPLSIKSGIQTSVRSQSGPARPGAMPAYLASRYIPPGSTGNSSAMRPPPARAERVPKESTTTSTVLDGPIHPNEWRRYTLVQVLPLNHNTKIFRFALPKRDLSLSLPLGQHLQVRARIEDEMVVRAYTPVSPPWQKGTFDLAIKRYDDGPLSQYIHNLDVGQVLEMKGPRGEFVYKPSKWKAMAMICAGTGITPVLQVIKGIFEDEAHKEEDRPKITVVMANRREEDMLFREDLEALQSRFPDHLQVHHLLSQPSDAWTGHRGRITQELLVATLPPPATAAETLFAYCGPTGFEVLVESSLLSLGYPVNQLFKF